MLIKVAVTGELEACAVVGLKRRDFFLLTIYFVKIEEMATFVGDEGEVFIIPEQDKASST